MREEYTAPGTDSPPAQPSAWQLRFGKKSSSRLQPQANGSKSEANIKSEARSPSISEQLLHALDAKPKEKEELSRDCVDELLGRRNAFATEPGLRLRTQTKCPQGGDMPEQIQFDHADVAAEVKEIIRVRLQIETQADSLRQTSGHRQRPKRQPEARCATQSRTATSTTKNLTSRKTARLSNTTSRCHEKKNPRIPLVRSESDNQTTGSTTTTAEPPRFQRQNNQEQQHSSSSGISSKKLLSRPTPPQQQPMERRQQLLQQARKARKMKAAEDQALRKLPGLASIDNNKENDQEQRRIQEQIERLTLENQQAAALEERLHNRRHRLNSLSNVFEGWRRYIECKQKVQTRVLAEFNWRILKRIVTHWKRYTHRQSHARSAEQARENLLREQHLNEQATNFHRSRRLPKWFYCWTTFVAHQKEQRATERVTDRRRVQSERLMERLQVLRQKKLADESQPNSAAQSESECDPDNGEEELPRAKRMIGSSPNVCERTSSKTNTSIRFRHRKSAWTSTNEHQTNPDPVRTREGEAPREVHVSPPALLPDTRAPKRVDKVYKAMEQRAVERKQRREELKQRYEELERKKREEQEEQRAAREALLQQQRTEEKTRIRERKLAEAIALKEKQERRDYMITQRYKADKHSRQRLLFYYALLPWRKHHVLVKRVTHNACRWHDLRTVYSLWGRWLEFVQIRRKLHRRRERAQLEVAARHHARILQRRALWSFMRNHQATEARALAVRRQNLWNTLRNSWARWCKRLMDERAYQRKKAFEAADKLQQEKLRRICAQWRRVTCDVKHQRELEHEKQQLWRKVRGWLDEDQ